MSDDAVRQPREPAGRVVASLYRDRFAPAQEGRRATAALEFVMASPLLICLLGGAADFGLIQFERAMLANAVAAGAEYAHLTGPPATAGDTPALKTAITSVIRNASNLPNAVTSVTVVFTGVGAPDAGWYCLTGSGASFPTWTSATQGGMCSDGSSAGYYISFRASYTNVGLMNGFMGLATQTMSEYATVRLN